MATHLVSRGPHRPVLAREILLVLVLHFVHARRVDAVKHRFPYVARSRGKHHELLRAESCAAPRRRIENP